MKKLSVGICGILFLILYIYYIYFMVNMYNSSEKSVDISYEVMDNNNNSNSQLDMLRIETIELAKLNVEDEIQRQRELYESSQLELEKEKNTYQAEITHYTAFCPTGCIGITTSGYDVSNTIYYEGYRVVAVPPSIDLYTKMKITYPDGTVIKAIALDRGGDIQSNHRLDLLVSDRRTAYQLGRQQVEVEILN